MENRSDILMLSGIVEMCPDCGAEAIFVPVDDEPDHDGCEFCCTACNAAVFLLPMIDSDSVGRHAA